jgi:hypothetical protein
VDLNRDGLKATGDGLSLCSGGAGAADDGLRGGRKEAGVFSVEIIGGEEILPILWSSGRFHHGEMEIKSFARKASKRRRGIEKDSRFEFLSKKDLTSNVNSNPRRNEKMLIISHCDV